MEQMLCRWSADTHSDVAHSSGKKQNSPGWLPPKAGVHVWVTTSEGPSSEAMLYSMAAHTSPGAQSPARVHCAG